MVDRGAEGGARDRILNGRFAMPGNAGPKSEKRLPVQRHTGRCLPKFSSQERAEPMNKKAAFQGARDHGNIR